MIKLKMNVIKEFYHVTSNQKANKIKTEKTIKRFRANDILKFLT